MEYNFDEIVNRKNTNSVKWDTLSDDGILPMWVADMDFKTAPEITQAILKKVSEGIFGYNIIPSSICQIIIDWWKLNHQVEIKNDELLLTPAMLTTISAVVRTFIKPGENIMLLTPVYNHFFSLAKKLDLNIIESELINNNGIFNIDFNDFEIKASNPKTTLLLICNPQNPIGKSWEEDELEKIAKICCEHNVMVISDEIHADLVYKKHTSFYSVSKNLDIISLTCASPCKTFNLSGLPISYVFSKNKDALAKIEKTLEKQETAFSNTIAATALIAAYTNGNTWLKNLKEYLWRNYIFLNNYCKQHLPEVNVTPLGATYLVWLDCKKLNKTSEMLAKLLIEEEKLWLNAGTIYGKSGEGYLRINIACPKSQLLEALTRLKHFINN